MKVYIYGPMAGIPQHNYPAFNRAAADLRAAGYEIVNPAELHPMTTTLTRQAIMKVDLAHMLTCDCIASLPGNGWKESWGATSEHYVALLTGMEITTVETLLTLAPLPAVHTGLKLAD